MTHNFFISHYSNDKEIAEIIASSIQRITLRQILPWYSSDMASTGGLKPGNIWFNEILSKINKSKAIVVLLTPNSINRHWIYFESGIGVALENCEVIPICIGIKRDSTLPPLGMYQCYQLTDYRALKEFRGKLLNKFEISFDEEMSKPLLEKALSDLLRINFENSEVISLEMSQPKVLIEELKLHIDRRFVEFLNNQQSKNILETHVLNESSMYLTDSVEYTIAVKINFPQMKETQFIEVRVGDTAADTFDAIYHLLREFVKPLTYLESWILVDKEKDRRLIIREIASMIPASIIFPPHIVWQVEKLEKPYKGTDSLSKTLR